MIENTVADQRGALVPALVEIRAGARDKRARKSLDSFLEEIIGFEPEDEGDCLGWHRAWVEAGRLAAEESAPTLAEVTAIYTREPASASLREAIVRVALRHQVRELAPLLVEDLERREKELRRVAYLGLRGFYSGIPTFDPAGKASLRKSQVSAIREFIERK